MEPSTFFDYFLQRPLRSTEAIMLIRYQFKLEKLTWNFRWPISSILKPIKHGHCHLGLQLSFTIHNSSFTLPNTRTFFTSSIQNMVYTKITNSVLFFLFLTLHIPLDPKPILQLKMSSVQITTIYTQIFHLHHSKLTNKNQPRSAYNHWVRIIP